MTDLSHIRNFAIIAHIDHGKSTLADRLIQSCGNLQEREMKAQILDSMDIERERGITIKAQTVRLCYTAQDSHVYQLNMIDTPGHVDFSYEVSRSLAACEGSLLVVDAVQGVEAQTLAHANHALEAGHEIIALLNKIDLPAADPNLVSCQVEHAIGLDARRALHISAKTGLGINDVLEATVRYLPPPSGEIEAPLKALLVDSWYDVYHGVIILIRVKDGLVKKGQNIHMLATSTACQVEQVGYFSPKMVACDVLMPGEVGYIVTGIRAISNCHIGDTLTESHWKTSVVALPGFKKQVPVVFCGLFPADPSSYVSLRDSLTKLALNDASFVYAAESSTALGSGFRCGFLGLLHMEVTQERLRREFRLELVVTAPSVVYRVHTIQGHVYELYNPTDIPDYSRIDHIEEPWIKATIMVPDPFLGAVLALCTERRGQQSDLTYVGNRVLVVYQLPLNEVVFDFYDRLKSISRGYASFDYELTGYITGDLVKVDILVNEEQIDAMTFIAHRKVVEARSRRICEKLRELIPRHLFKIPIQAAIGKRVIARETIQAIRKDVTAKCYGGDITRKRKLLEKQKEGKKKMRLFGRVSIPHSAFLRALSLESN